jgi:hypothetical protein
VLAHVGCLRLNPLYVNGELKSLKDDSLLWYDTSTSKNRLVDHWSLSVVHEASKNFPGIKEMWFPVEMLASVRDPAGQRGFRVLVRGSISVGKSVLSSVAVSQQTFQGRSQIGVDNYAYVTPSNTGEPFVFYAGVLQSLRDLRAYQPIAIGSTNTDILTLIRTGFYSRLPGTEQAKRALILYDLSGEDFQREMNRKADAHFRTADILYALIDVTHLSVFEGCYLNSEEIPESRAGSIAAGRDTVTASLQMRSRIRTIVVVTKLDLVLENLETAKQRVGLSEKQKEGLNSLEELQKKLRDAGSPPYAPIGDLGSLAQESLEILKCLLDSKNRIEQNILSMLSDLDPVSKVEGAFFVWTEGLARAQKAPAPVMVPAEVSAQPAPAGNTPLQTASSTQAPKIETAPAFVESQPISPYGVAELVTYTLTQQEKPA